MANARVNLPISWHLLGLAVVCVTLVARAVSAQTAVTGTVTLAGTVSLPPEAALDLTLEEETTGGGTPRVIGRSRQMVLGRQPLAFAIPYDVQAIYARGRFVVRATVSAKGEVLFVTAEAPRVLTAGSGSTVALELQPVSQAPVSAVSLQESLRPEATSPLGRLPASFTGVLGCRGCSTGRSRLDLWPDGTFQLASDTAATGARWSGEWMVSSDERVLRVVSPGASVSLFAIASSGTLVALDGDGRPSPSATPLTRQPGSPRAIPVRRTPDATRPQALVLEDQEWLMVRLPRGGNPTAAQSSGEPRIRFSSTGQVSGTVSCSRIAGRFTKSGHSFSVPAIAAMPHTCGAEVSAASSLVSALGHVATYRLLGDWLELLDHQGELLVRFEARPITPKPPGTW